MKRPSTENLDSSSTTKKISKEKPLPLIYKLNNSYSSLSPIEKTAYLNLKIMKISPLDERIKQTKPTFLPNNKNYPEDFKLYMIKIQYKIYFRLELESAKPINNIFNQDIINKLAEKFWFIYENTNYYKKLKGKAGPNIKGDNYDINNISEMIGSSINEYKKIRAYILSICNCLQNSINKFNSKSLPLDYTKYNLYACKLAHNLQANIVISNYITQDILNEVAKIYTDCISKYLINPNLLTDYKLIMNRFEEVIDKYEEKSPNGEYFRDTLRKKALSITKYITTGKAHNY